MRRNIAAEQNWSKNDITISKAADQEGMHQNKVQLDRSG